LKDEISDAQSRLQEKEDEFRSVKQEISKLKDETATDEIAPALQEIQQLISLPNRCPVCTRDVDPEQQQRFNDHGDCPLCGKDVPDDRYETVSEVDEEGEVVEREKRQEELEELESRRRTLEGEIEFLEEELEEKRDQLETLKLREEQSGFAEYKREKEKIEQEIENLRDKNTSLELSIDAKKGTLHGVARQVWEWSQIDEERQRKEQRMDALESYQNIISEERKEARRRLKNRLEERMESLWTSSHAAPLPMPPVSASTEAIRTATRSTGQTTHRNRQDCWGRLMQSSFYICCFSTLRFWQSWRKSVRRFRSNCC